MARDPKVDPTEELGTSLSPSERATRVLQATADKETGEFGLSAWELNFIRSNAESTWPSFTKKQEAVMQRIEAKVFNEPLQKIEDDDGFPF